MALLPDVSGILARMYTDRMDVRRYKEGEDADGNAETVLDPVPVLEGVPCRISFQDKDSPVLSSDGNPTDVRPMLICSPDVPLQSGDFITVTRKGAVVYTGNIGRPNPYGSSLQSLFQDKGVS